MFTERTSVGLDVHARSVVAAAIDGVTGELIQTRLTPSHEHIHSWLRDLPGPIAVAYEALGLFDQAQTYYKKALDQDPRNAGLKRNYSRFVEFYQSFKPDQPGAPPAEEPAAAADEQGEPLPTAPIDQPPASPEPPSVPVNPS